MYLHMRSFVMQNKQRREAAAAEEGNVRCHPLLSGDQIGGSSDEFEASGLVDKNHLGVQLLTSQQHWRTGP